MAVADIRELTFEHVLDTILKPAGVKVGGFPDDIFVDLTEKEKEEWLCNICFRIVNECRQCSNNHKFCATCIFAWSLTFGENSQLCPVCRNPQTSYEECKEVVNKLQNRMVKCDGEGCSDKFPLRIFLLHSHGRSKYSNSGIDLESLRPPRLSGRHFFISGLDAGTPRDRMNGLRGQLSQGRLMIQQMMMLLHLEMQLRQQAVQSTARAEVRLQQLDEVLALNEQLSEVGTILSLLLDTPLSDARSRSQQQSNATNGTTATAQSLYNNNSQSSTGIGRTHQQRLRADSPYRTGIMDSMDDEDEDESEDESERRFNQLLYRRSESEEESERRFNQNRRSQNFSQSSSGAANSSISNNHIRTNNSLLQRNVPPAANIRNGTRENAVTDSPRILTSRGQQQSNSLRLLPNESETDRTDQPGQISFLAINQQSGSSSTLTSVSNNIAPIRTNGLITYPSGNGARQALPTVRQQVEIPVLLPGRVSSATRSRQLDHQPLESSVQGNNRNISSLQSQANSVNGQQALNQSASSISRQQTSMLNNTSINQSTPIATVGLIRQTAMQSTHTDVIPPQIQTTNSVVVTRQSAINHNNINNSTAQTSNLEARVTHERGIILPSNSTIVNSSDPLPNSSFRNSRSISSSNAVQDTAHRSAPKPPISLSRLEHNDDSMQIGRYSSQQEMATLSGPGNIGVAAALMPQGNRSRINAVKKSVNQHSIRTHNSRLQAQSEVNRPAVRRASQLSNADVAVLPRLTMSRQSNNVTGQHNHRIGTNDDQLPTSHHRLRPNNSTTTTTVAGLNGSHNNPQRAAAAPLDDIPRPRRRSEIMLDLHKTARQSRENS